MSDTAIAQQRNTMQRERAEQYHATRSPGITGDGRGPISGVPVAPSRSMAPNAVTSAADRRDGLNRQIESIMREAPDSEAMRSRLNAAVYLADLIDAPVDDVFRNFDQYQQAYSGAQRDPQTAFGYIADGWRIGQLSVSRARIGERLVADPTDAEALAMLEDLNSQMPDEPTQRRSLPVQAMRSLLQMAPFSLETARQGAEQGLAGALGGAAAATIAGQIGPQIAIPEEIVTVPGAAVAGWHVGRRAGSVQEAMRMSQGLIVADVVQEAAAVGVELNPTILRSVSAGAGFLSGLLEATQLERLTGGNRILTRALQRSVQKAMQAQLAGRAGVRALGRFGRNYVANIATETAQEIAQESIEFAAGELVKLLEEENIPQADLEDFLALVAETARQSALAFSIAGLPGAVVETRTDLRTERDVRSRLRDVGSSKDVAANLEAALNSDALSMVSDEQIPGLIDAIDEATPITTEEISIDTTDSGIAARARGRILAEVDMDLSDDTAAVDFRSLPDGDNQGVILRQVINRIQRDHPTLRIQVDSTTDTGRKVQRILEDQHPEVRRLNQQIDLARETIADIDEVIADARSEVQQLREGADENGDALLEDPAERIAELGELIADQEQVRAERFERIAEIESVKQTHAPTDTRPDWALDGEEYADRRQADDSIDSRSYRDTSGGQRLRQRLQDVAGLSRPEADAITELVRARAEASGQDVDTFVSQRFTDEAIRQEVTPGMAARSSPASVLIEDGRALVRISEAATFRDVLEEVLHVIRQTLTPEERASIAEAVGQADPEAPWSIEAEERFVSLVEQYLSDGVAPTPWLAATFEKISGMLRSLLTGLRETLPMSEEVRQSIDRLFTPDDAQATYTPSSDPLGDLERIMVDLSEEHRGDPEGWERGLYAQRGRVRSLIEQIESGQNKADAVGGAYVAGIRNRLEDVERRYSGDVREMYAQSPQRAAEVRQAVERRDPVPRTVLEEFAGQAWADEELAYRRGIEQRRSDFSDLYERARESGSVDDFVRTTLSQMGGQDATPEVQQFLEDIYHDAMVDDVDAGNRLWIHTLADEHIIEVATQLAEMGAGAVPVNVVASRVRNGREISPRMMKALRNHLKNNATVYRRNLSMNDDQETRRIQLEQLKTAEQGIADDATVETARPQKITYQDLAGRYPEIAETESFRRMVARSMTALEVAELAEQMDAILADQTAKAEQRRKAQATREAAKRYRDHMRSLAHTLTRKLPKNIDVEYRQMIESIQSQVDPSFRSRKTMQRLSSQRDWLQRNPEAAEVLNDSQVSAIQKKPLNEWTADELQQMIDTVQVLIRIGRNKQRIKQEMRTRNVRRNVAAIRDRLEDPEIGGEPIIRDRRTLRDSGRRLYYATLRPSRIADMVDGKTGDFSGPAHKLFIDDANTAREQELRRRMDREQFVHDALADLGMKPLDLAKKRSVDGFSDDLSLDEMLDIWAKWQNPRAQMALMFGNGISQAQYMAIDKALTATEKKAARTIMQDYDNNYDRLRQAHIDYANEDMGRESHYTPLIRMERDFTSHRQQLKSEILIRAGFRNARPERGFTKSRKTMRAEFQKPVRLGLYTTWAEQIVKQEHYIASAELAYIQQRVLSDGGLKESIRATYGIEAHRELQEYANRFANPYAHRAYNPYRSTLRRLRQNVAVAFLAGNMLTVFKQLPSVAFYLGDSSPSHLLGAISETVTDWKRVREFVTERDAQVLDASLDRAYDELKELAENGSFGHIRKMTVNTGMRLIRAMDSIARTAGWKAVYEASRDAGFSEAEAIRRARNATLRTQPAGDPKDTATILGNESLYMLTQFSNQLNQIWNMTTYDIPAWFRNGHAGNALYQMLGLALSAWVLWAISARRPLPEDREDAIDLIAGQLVNMIPVLGPAAASIGNGYSPEVTALTPVESVFALGDLAAELATGDVEDAQRAAWRVYEGVAIGVGLPYILPRRTAKGVEVATERGEGWPTVAQYILFGGKWYLSKEEQQREER